MKKILILTLVVLLIAVSACSNEQGTNNSAQNTATASNNQNSDSSGEIKIEVSNPATLTLDDISKHNTEADCWIVYESSVYDVTDFLTQHPGGVQAIAEHCGTSEEFQSAFTAQHGASKVNTLMKEARYIGDLNGN